LKPPKLAGQGPKAPAANLSGLEVKILAAAFRLGNCDQPRKVAGAAGVALGDVNKCFERVQKVLGVSNPRAAIRTAYQRGLLRV
jgi:hypothetical protein